MHVGLGNAVILTGKVLTGSRRPKTTNERGSIVIARPVANK